MLIYSRPKSTCSIINLNHRLLSNRGGGALLQLKTQHAASDFLRIGFSYRTRRIEWCNRTVRCPSLRLSDSPSHRSLRLCDNLWHNSITSSTVHRDSAATNGVAEPVDCHTHLLCSNQLPSLSSHMVGCSSSAVIRFRAAQPKGLALHRVAMAIPPKPLGRHSQYSFYSVPYPTYNWEVGGRMETPVRLNIVLNSTLTSSHE